MRLLVRREHSDRELRRKLAERGVAAADAASALESLKDRNFQSDARFGESLVRRRLEAGYGPRVIEAELASHGIGRGAAAALLEGENWDERARAVLVRRVRGEAADAAVRRKLATWLERRGYPAGAIRFALGALGRGEVDNPA
jgi:regulatory protein